MDPDATSSRPGAETRRGSLSPVPPVLFSGPDIYPATSGPCCMLFACSILELELFILYVIGSIWELEPSMSNAIFSILELELSI